METENPYPVQRETVKNRKEGGEVILFFEVYMDKSFKERVKSPDIIRKRQKIKWNPYFLVVEVILLQRKIRDQGSKFSHEIRMVKLLATLLSS